MRKSFQELKDPYEIYENNFVYSRFYEEQIRYLEEENIMKNSIIESLIDTHIKSSIITLTIILIVIVAAIIMTTIHNSDLNFSYNDSKILTLILKI